MSDMLVTLLHACPSSVHRTKKSFYFLFYFWTSDMSLSNSLALFLSFTQSNSLDLLSCPLDLLHLLANLLWVSQINAARSSSVSLFLSLLAWYSCLFFHSQCENPPTISLSLTVKHSWSSVLSSVSQMGAAQSLSASLSPFLGKKRIFKCLYFWFFFNKFFGGGGGRQKQI